MDGATLPGGSPETPCEAGYGLELVEGPDTVAEAATRLSQDDAIPDILIRDKIFTLNIYFKKWFKTNSNYCKYNLYVINPSKTILCDKNIPNSKSITKFLRC